MVENNIRDFRRIVWNFYKTNGRHDLPWRPPTLKLRRDKTLDAYRVLVSEIMLQQTQVERVIPFYKKFIKRFPTAKKLAAAPLSDVLKSWQGLGYNRRAKMLQAAAKEAVGKYKSIFPAVYSELVELPGIGPYTARAIAAFSYNENVIFVETNIRTAVIHHFFSRRSDVEDTEVLEVLKKALPKGKSREWYSALMDYGAHLKRSGISHNARSSRYIKQSKFVGSLREARGAILRELTKGFQTEKRLVGLLGDDRVSQMRTALTALVAEKFVVKKRSSFALAG
ncbi:hypothetical protein A3J11_02075 [Candidatus Kaiserbacteria bacterium RIFCSPLOWO2_02_FULL_55_12]|uniref:Adenine DNA glycosylase n=2 Tax=Candidatus Kaiseribacteriota TaxID=1752734 RepID=A0A1F6F0B5_9BACT|nr:MAG: hypothetical protein A3C94_00570 [Candidatus Kaiserbacteria bacterium RIFCSPHIGHO2_02_FULL_55_17]OGG79312.1 MAG: hypothetical protein A3J11_02075 [Candidatus Kaiserbacteria bacterium RIFCSPLOWO2_02_FULL_55_12]